MSAFSPNPGDCVAAAQSGAAASGGFLTSSLPYNVTSIGAPASSVYLVTVADGGIDQLWSAAFVSVGTVARAATVVWTADTTWNVTGSDLATPTAADTIFQFMVLRTHAP